MTINERVKMVREALNYTQAEFGRKIDASQAYLANIENGTKPVTPKIFKLICKEFGVREKWLRDGEGDIFMSEAELLVLLGSQLDTLDDIDKKILTEYIKLTPAKKKVIKEFIRRVANEES